MIFTVGRKVFTASETPGEQTATAHRHDDRVEIRHLRDNLEARRSLTGDDRGIVVAVDIGQPLLGRDLMGARFSFCEIPALQHNRRASFLAVVDFNERGEFRHHDRGRHA
jgi:hypothetical protein